MYRQARAIVLEMIRDPHSAPQSDASGVSDPAPASFSWDGDEPVHMERDASDFPDFSEFIRLRTTPCFMTTEESVMENEYEILEASLENVRRRSGEIVRTRLGDEAMRSPPSRSRIFVRTGTALVALWVVTAIAGWGVLQGVVAFTRPTESRATETRPAEPRPTESRAAASPLFTAEVVGTELLSRGETTELEALMEDIESDGDSVFSRRDAWENLRYTYLLGEPEYVATAYERLQSLPEFLGDGAVMDARSAHDAAMAGFEQGLAEGRQLLVARMAAEEAIGSYHAVNAQLPKELAERELQAANQFAVALDGVQWGQFPDAAELFGIAAQLYGDLAGRAHQAKVDSANRARVAAAERAQAIQLAEDRTGRVRDEAESLLGRMGELEQKYASEWLAKARSSWGAGEDARAADKEVHYAAAAENAKKAIEIGERARRATFFVSANYTVYGGGRYIDNQDGTILDRETLLLWQKHDFVRANARDAADIANENRVAGWSGWRVPTVSDAMRLGIHLNPASETPFVVHDEENIMRVLNGSGKVVRFDSATGRSEGRALFAKKGHFRLVTGPVQPFELPEAN